MIATLFYNHFYVYKVLAYANDEKQAYTLRQEFLTFPIIDV